MRIVIDCNILVSAARIDGDRPADGDSARFREAMSQAWIHSAHGLVSEGRTAGRRLPRERGHPALDHSSALGLFHTEREKHPPRPLVRICAHGR